MTTSSIPLRRVVVTGLGIVSPLGSTIPSAWKNLVSSKSGIVSLKCREDGVFDELPCTVAGLVPIGDNFQEGELNLDTILDKGEDRKTSRFIQYALSATHQALQDADWFPKNETSKERTGVTIGSGIGSMQDIESSALTYSKDGTRRISPFFIPKMLVNMASGWVSMKYGFQGPNHSVSTACTTGAHSLGDAMRMIQFGDADVMVAGGSEAGICPLAMAGFIRAKALCTKYNDKPSESSRPFDKDRCGFVMGEGAGVVVLEEYHHAKSRNANIYAEICGYGMSGDANHITAPPADGRGAQLSMKRAIQTAQVQPQDVDYINAHATSTELGDISETAAIKTVFGPHAKNLNVSSTKSSTGHLLGAAGAVEAIFSILAIKENTVPPTINLPNPDISAGLDLNYTPNVAVKKRVDVALTNSFGFGGTNASLVFRRI